MMHVSTMAMKKSMSVAVNQSARNTWVNIDTDDGRISIHAEPETLQQLALDLHLYTRQFLRPDQVIPVEQMSLPPVFISTDILGDEIG